MSLEQLTPSEIFEEEVMRLKRIHDPGWRLIWDHVQDLKKQHKMRLKELTEKLKEKSERIKAAKEDNKTTEHEVKSRIGQLTDRIIDLERKESEVLGDAERLKLEVAAARAEKETLKANISSLLAANRQLKRASERKYNPDKAMQKRINDAQAYIKTLHEIIDGQSKTGEDLIKARQEIAVLKQELDLVSHDYLITAAGKTDLRLELKKRQQRLDEAEAKIVMLEQIKEEHSRCLWQRIQKTKTWAWIEKILLE